MSDRSKDYLLKPTFSHELSESIITKGRLIMRGTPEWDVRELKRAALGCQCIALGDIGDDPSWRGTLQ